MSKFPSRGPCRYCFNIVPAENYAMLPDKGMVCRDCKDPYTQFVAAKSATRQLFEALRLHANVPIETLAGLAERAERALRLERLRDVAVRLAELANEYLVPRAKYLPAQLLDAVWDKLRQLANIFRINVPILSRGLLGS